MVRFDLGPLLQGQTRIAKLKRAHNSLIVGRTGLGWQTNLQEIMGQESFDVVRFDLGSLLQGQSRIPKLKSAYISLIIVLHICNVKPIYRKSWTGNFLIGPI